MIDVEAVLALATLGLFLYCVIRPGRAAAADPAKDEEFLRQVRERAEKQRRAYEQQRGEPDPDQ